MNVDKSSITYDQIRSEQFVQCRVFAISFCLLFHFYPTVLKCIQYCCRADLLLCEPLLLFIARCLVIYGRVSIWHHNAVKRTNAYTENVKSSAIDTLNILKHPYALSQRRYIHLPSVLMTMQAAFARISAKFSPMLIERFYWTRALTTELDLQCEFF